MSNPNEELLTDEEIEARQRAEDGETESTDPNVDEASADEATTAQATDTPAADDKPATQEAAVAEQAGATAEPAAEKPAGGEAQDKVDGVLSKDGQRVIPYSALQAARRDARRAESRAERTERELAEAKQLIEDLKAGKTMESEELTEERVAEMEEHFPEEGKRLRAAFNRIQELEKQVPKAQPTQEEIGDDPVQEAIDQVPLLLEWQHQDAEKFSRAVEHDAVLVKSPKWADKPAVDRFTEAARRTAEEYDIEFPTQQTSRTAATQTAPQTAAVQAAQRKPPETLSDFKGGSVADHNSMDVAKASPQALLSRMQSMSDDEIDAHLAKYGG